MLKNLLSQFLKHYKTEPNFSILQISRLFSFLHNLTKLEVKNIDQKKIGTLLELLNRKIKNYSEKGFQPKLYSLFLQSLKTHTFVFQFSFQPFLLKRIHLTEFTLQESISVLQIFQLSPPINAEKITFKKCELTKESAYILKDFLPHCRSLKALSLPQNVLRNRGIRRVLQASLHIPRINIASNYADDNCIKSIAKFILLNKRLQYLNIIGNNLEYLDELLPAIEENSSLIHLKYDQETIDYYRDLFSNLLKNKKTNIRHLQAIFTGFGGANLDCVKIPLESLILERLWSPPEDIEFIQHCLSLKSLTKIGIVSCRNSEVEGKIMTDAISTNPNLTTLKLCGPTLTDRLFRIINSEQITIGTQKNSIVVENRWRSLVSIDLSTCIFDSDSLLQLGRYLQLNNNLRELFLTECRLGNFKPYETKQILNSIAEASHIMLVDISKNNFAFSQILHLANILVDNTTTVAFPENCCSAFTQPFGRTIVVKGTDRIARTFQKLYSEMREIGRKNKNDETFKFDSNVLILYLKFLQIAKVVSAANSTYMEQLNDMNPFIDTSRTRDNPSKNKKSVKNCYRIPDSSGFMDIYEVTSSESDSSEEFNEENRLEKIHSNYYLNNNELIGELKSLDKILKKIGKIIFHPILQIDNFLNQSFHNFCQTTIEFITKFNSRHVQMHTPLKRIHLPYIHTLLKDHTRLSILDINLTLLPLTRFISILKTFTPNTILKMAFLNINYTYSEFLDLFKNMLQKYPNINNLYIRTRAPLKDSDLLPIKFPLQKIYEQSGRYQFKRLGFNREVLLAPQFCKVDRRLSCEYRLWDWRNEGEWKRRKNLTRRGNGNNYNYNRKYQKKDYCYYPHENVQLEGESSEQKWRFKVKIEGEYISLGYEPQIDNSIKSKSYK